MFTVDGFFYNAWFSHGLSLKLNTLDITDTETISAFRFRLY